MDAPLRPSVADSRAVTACSSHLPRGHRAGHRRRQGSEIRRNCCVFLFNVRYKEGPSLNVNQPFGGPIDPGVCGDGYDDYRPELAVPRHRKPADAGFLNGDYRPISDLQKREDLAKADIQRLSPAARVSASVLRASSRC